MKKGMSMAEKLKEENINLSDKAAETLEMLYLVATNHPAKEEYQVRRTCWMTVQGGSELETSAEVERLSIDDVRGHHCEIDKKTLREEGMSSTCHYGLLFNDDGSYDTFYVTDKLFKQLLELETQKHVLTIGEKFGMNVPMQNVGINQTSMTCILDGVTICKEITTEKNMMEDFDLVVDTCMQNLREVNNLMLIPDEQARFKAFDVILKNRIPDSYGIESVKNHTIEEFAELGISYPVKNEDCYIGEPISFLESVTHGIPYDYDAGRGADRGEDAVKILNVLDDEFE